MNVLKKETERRNYSRGTGGGSPMKVNFTDIEEKLLELLIPEAAGIENIPQGGIPALKKSHSEQILRCRITYYRYYVYVPQHVIFQKHFLNVCEM